MAAANALLEAAGWPVGADGVRVRDGRRLSSTIAVRPTSVDLFTFANEAAEQLSDCGIELIVEELDLTGDTMLEQLLWPNDFDTLLLTRMLGPDPDSAVRAFESSRIITEENQADANPSGFTSSLADHLIKTARETLDQDERVAAYAGVHELIEADVPYWPLWYQSAVSALSSRVQGPDGRHRPVRRSLRLGCLQLDAGTAERVAAAGPWSRQGGTFGPVVNPSAERPYSPMCLWPPPREPCACVHDAKEWLRAGIISRSSPPRRGRAAEEEPLE